MGRERSSYLFTDGKGSEVSIKRGAQFYITGVYLGVDAISRWEIVQIKPSLVLKSKPVKKFGPGVVMAKLVDGQYIETHGQPAHFEPGYETHFCLDKVVELLKSEVKEEVRANIITESSPLAPAVA
jgi:hypothetical protein